MWQVQTKQDAEACRCAFSTLEANPWGEDMPNDGEEAGIDKPGWFRVCGLGYQYGDGTFQSIQDENDDPGALTH